MYVTSGSYFVRTDGTGRVMVDTREHGPSFVLPRVLWSNGTLPPAAENPPGDAPVVGGVGLKA